MLKMEGCLLCRRQLSAYPEADEESIARKRMSAIAAVFAFSIKLTQREVFIGAAEMEDEKNLFVVRTVEK